MSIAKRVTLSVLMALLLSAGCARCTQEDASPTKSGVKTAGPWSVLTGYDLGAVTWSPDSDSVAFTAARPEDNPDIDPVRQSIWIMSVPKDDGQVKLKRLVVLTRTQDIPVALFWLDEKRVGWATSWGPDYSFMQMGLGDDKPRRLVNQKFQGVRDMVESYGGCGPNDVFYDVGSRTLLFSGGLTPIGAYVRVLPLSTGAVRDTSVPHPKGLAYPDGYVGVVTLCGSLHNPHKPVFYLAAAIRSKEDGSWCLWRSDSYALKQDSVIATSSEWITYPRMSPDGKLLAYIDGGQLVLRHLESGKSTKSVRLYATDSSACGCPYSWSPDGKQIAYADGSQIKIVRVPNK